MRSTLSHLSGLLFGALLAVHGASFASGQDNLLIIVADDVGVDMIGAYGEGPDPPQTPTIDQLASEGVLFRNVWANPTCSPTRAEMHTGRYGHHTGVGLVVSNLGWSLQQDETTFAEVLARYPELGYTTGLIGKWHLSNWNNGYLDGPLLQGFDHFTGARENVRSDLGYRFDKWLRVENGVESQCTTYATVQQVDDALAFIATAPEPWVCMLNFNAPHEPFHRPPANMLQRILPDGNPRLNPPPFYKAAVEALDMEVGRLLTSIGPAMASTNIVFTADNGTPQLASEAPFLPSHAKLTPYEGGLNVPLIVTGPIVAQPGREVIALVGATDMYSSALELCGVTDASVLEPGVNHDSYSFVPYLKYPTQSAIRDHVYAEMFSPNGPAGLMANNDVRAIRNERYKLIRRGITGGPYQWEFYDLIADPFETHNIFRKGTHAPAALPHLHILLNKLALLTN